jgi:hypothetical protein
MAACVFSPGRITRDLRLGSGRHRSPHSAEQSRGAIHLAVARSAASLAADRIAASLSGRAPRGRIGDCAPAVLKALPQTDERAKRVLEEATAR